MSDMTVRIGPEHVRSLRTAVDLLRRLNDLPGDGRVVDGLVIDDLDELVSRAAPPVKVEPREPANRLMAEVSDSVQGYLHSVRADSSAYDRERDQLADIHDMREGK